MYDGYKETSTPGKITIQKPSNLWDATEHAIFLKYCPSKRDRCYHAMANDMSARPHEILNLRIQYIIFKVTDEALNMQRFLLQVKRQNQEQYP